MLTLFSVASDYVFDIDDAHTHGWCAALALRGAADRGGRLRPMVAASLRSSTRCCHRSLHGALHGSFAVNLAKSCGIATVVLMACMAGLVASWSSWATRWSGASVWMGTSTMGRWFGATMVTMVIAAALLPAGRPGQVKDTGSRKTFAATTDLGDFMASERCLAGPFDDGAAAAFRCLLLSQSGSI
eukprot:CAMPEP_0178375334 /NCGR_PEP_ID=MMETSP0689_2-20121128/2833_1 /TAXON_ID=160604 /ORGANISM="Amphidinium massartii, Strain CS-259" /LENGTH=185 /DNA_ID=CAMNT_0019995321 /DNA_START=285 /DNA_END=842 /DNA_ORIENTATION=+